jgi:hypothetical protein
MKANSRCAIYTRKSSEEGLEQSFNSLHAQRETWGGAKHLEYSLADHAPVTLSR